MYLLIARHGEAQDDIEDCYGGIADFELTDSGRQAAAALAESVRGCRLDAIYSSPLRRARETAEIVARTLGLSVEVVDALQERNSYGVLSGVNKAKAKALFPTIFAGLKEKPGYSREPLLGAEDFDQFLGRVAAAFRAVTDAATAKSQERVLIVTHGKFSRALFEEVLRVPGLDDLELSSAVAVEYLPPRASLVRISDVT
jgi:broad specificity phosphatase PhoE